MTETLVAQEEVETRSAEVADVSYPKRLVTVIAMPYEQPTDIVYRGKPITEVVSRNAFDGIERRTKTIRVNRDHSWDKVIGKIVGLHPSRKEGLVAEVRMFTTRDGDDALTLADEGGLDASAGFGLLRRPDGRVYDDAETWLNNRSVRRLNRIFLDHLALVPDPAYQGATVLDVRAAQQPDGAYEATPNRDRLTLADLKAQYEAMNSRWAH
jgi:phage head maturation protease